MKAENNISVVITCFREGELIFDAIDSILNQSPSPLEIIIVNDASPDETTNNACRELESNPLIKVIWCENNGGTSVARNKGFEAAKGEILVPLDADDILPSNSLELIVQTFTKYPDAGFVYGSYLRQDKADVEGKIINPGKVTLKSMLQAKQFSLSTNWKLLGTTPLRKSLWQSIGGYDRDFGVKDLHDVEFWIRAFDSRCDYYQIPDVIYIWRKYLGSNSNKVTPVSWYRIAQKHFAIYQKIGLEHRAYELLLLGSKWLNDPEKIKLYSQELRRCIYSGDFQFSSAIALMFPCSLLQYMAKIVSSKR